MTVVENKYYNSRGGSWAWSRLAKRVVREEPHCWLKLEGCTGLSQVADHIIPKALRPDLVMVRENCRGACRSCNAKRGKKSRVRARQQTPRQHGQPAAAEALGFFS